MLTNSLIALSKRAVVLDLRRLVGNGNAGSVQNNARVTQKREEASPVFTRRHPTYHRHYLIYTAASDGFGGDPEFSRGEIKISADLLLHFREKKTEIYILSLGDEAERKSGISIRS